MEKKGRTVTLFEKINRLSLLPPSNDEISIQKSDQINLKESPPNMNDIKDEYDLGAQNYVVHKDQSSSEVLNAEGCVEIETRKRIRSFVYGRKRGADLVILNSRHEEKLLDHQQSSSKSKETSHNKKCYDNFHPILNIFIFIKRNILLLTQEYQESFNKVVVAQDNAREININIQKTTRILLPGSRFHKHWSLMIILLIVYEYLVIPMKISFQIEVGSIFLLILDIIIFILFSIDIFIGFKTAFINNRGVIELNPIHISNHYKRRYLLLDFLANFPTTLILQVAAYLVPHSSLFDGQLDKYDYIKLIFLNKLFRISKISRIISKFDENTLYNPAKVRIAKSFIFLMFLWHWIACIYWYISIKEGFKDGAWTPSIAFLYKSTFSQYNYAILWAVTVTVGIGLDISPKTNTELIFTSLVIVIGVALYGILLGSTSSAFLSIDDQEADLRKQMDCLNNFMRKKKVSFELQKRIEENLKYLWSSQQTLNVANQWFLNGVHSLLKVELCIQLNKQYLDKIPMFRDISFNCLVFLLSLLESRIYLPEEFVLCEGSYSQNLYFIQSGILEVIDKRNNTRIRLYDGEFFGEQSLFVLKKKTADIKCLSYSELLIISKDALMQLIEKFPDFAINLFFYLKNKDLLYGKQDKKRRFWDLVRYCVQIARFMRRNRSKLTFEELFCRDSEIKDKKVKDKKGNKIKNLVIEALNNKDSNIYLSSFSNKMKL